MITVPLQKVIDGELSGNAQTADDYRELWRVAESWAAHSLRTYSGKTLKRALAISHALAEFTAKIGGIENGRTK